VADPATLRQAIGFYDRRWRSTRRSPGLGSARPRSRSPLHQRHAHTGARSAGAARRGAGPGARPRPPRGTDGAGGLLPVRGADNRKAVEAVEAGLKLAPNNVDLLVTAALAEQRLGQLEYRTPASRQGERARPPLGEHGAAHRGRLALSAPLPRGPRGHGPGPRARPHQPRDHRAEGHGGPRPGRLARRPGCRAHGPQHRRSRGAARLPGQLSGPLLGTGRRPAAAAPDSAPSAFDDDRATWAIIRARPTTCAGIRPRPGSTPTRPGSLRGAAPRRA
jgi:hypothetical protein